MATSTSARDANDEFVARWDVHTHFRDSDVLNSREEFLVELRRMRRCDCVEPVPGPVFDPDVFHDHRDHLLEMLIERFE